MPVILLSDNDIIKKLALCDLLDDAIQVLGHARSEIRVLPRARYVFRIRDRASGIQRVGSEAAFERIRTFLESVQPLEVEPDDADVQTLIDVQNIDLGEAQLYASATRLSSFRLVTGDKRSLRSLCEDPSCRSIADRVRGHVVCLEQIFLRLLAARGFDYVAGRTEPHRHCDIVLQNAFCPGPDASDSRSRGVLDEYVRQVRAYPIDLLEP